MLEIKTIAHGGNENERQLHIVTNDGKVFDFFAPNGTEAAKFLQKTAEQMGHAIPVP